MTSRRRRSRGAKKAIALVLLALVCASVLSACGAKQDVTSAARFKRLTVMLDWTPNADHAPLYTAIEDHFFHDAGLEVRPVVPSEAAEPLKLLAAGKVDLAISYEPELLLARDEGLKLVSIAAFVQRPLTSIIAITGSHVHSIADLAGKKVGTAGIPYQAAELKTALKSADVNPESVTEVNVGFNLVPAMLSGKVAATLGGFWNYEAIELRQMHKHPVVIPVDKAGVPSYDELVLVTREDEARHHGTELRAFLQALSRGASAVKTDPSAAVAAVKRANPELEPKLQLASIEQTLPAMRPSGGEPYGWQSPRDWQRFEEWMFSEGLLKHDPDKVGLPPFTNEFLPGEGI